MMFRMHCGCFETSATNCMRLVPCFHIKRRFRASHTLLPAVIRPPSMAYHHNRWGWVVMKGGLCVGLVERVDNTRSACRRKAWISPCRRRLQVVRI